MVNPLVKTAIRYGVAPPGYAIIETVGRKSGLPRRTPVGYRLEGDTLWLVAEHGHRAAYVRNIGDHPGVRVKVRRHWRTGTAQLMPEDDPRERLNKVGLRFNSLVVRAMSTDLLTVRIDLHPR